ncbi:hypothetical protein EDD22DRAFT_957729 [Suillus occidentalis]|nr:hypothetical protein EDD22DRAFT_957729 [Suillus occidentalis]
MQANQDIACIDAPKPKCPRARPVGKAAQASKTPNSTIDDGQAGAEIVANKPIGTKETRIQLLSSIASTLGSMSKLKQL